MKTDSKQKADDVNVGAGSARPKNKQTMYNPDIHHRRSIRLKEYDYSSEGLYFVTICSHEHKCVFGEIIDDNIILNRCGNIIDKEWKSLPQHFPNIVCHEYIIMPNHIHGIIQIEERIQGGPTPPLRKTTLGNILAYYKYRTTKQLDQRIPLWQRNYYEHIIRNQQSYEEIAAYIVENPVHWKRDKLYKD